MAVRFLLSYVCTIKIKQIKLIKNKTKMKATTTTTTTTEKVVNFITALIGTGTGSAIVYTIYTIATN